LQNVSDVTAVKENLYDTDLWFSNRGLQIINSLYEVSTSNKFFKFILQSTY